MIDPEQQSEQAVIWTLPTREVVCHYGMHPSSVPWGSYCVATGIDGTQMGTARRMSGGRTWADLIVTDFTTDILNNGVTGLTNWEDRGIHQCFPFSITLTNKSGGYAVGLVVWNRVTTTAWLYAQIYDGTTEHTDPYASTTHRLWTLIPNAVDDVTGRTFTDGISRVVCQGQFLYLLADGVGADSCALNRTLWFDWDLWAEGGNTGTPGTDNVDGWVIDYFGVPKVGEGDIANKHLWVQNLFATPAGKVIVGRRYGSITGGDYAAQLAQMTFPAEAGKDFGVLFAADGTSLSAAGAIDCDFKVNDSGIVKATGPMTQVSAPANWWTIDFDAADWPATEVWRIRLRFDNGAGTSYPDETYGSYSEHQTDQAGHCIQGTYGLDVTLVDEFRTRVTGRAKRWYDPFASGGESWVLSIGDGWYLGCLIEGTATAMGNLALVEAQAAEYWTQYQLWATLSTQDLTQSPADVVYFVDQMGLSTGWTGAAGELTKFLAYYGETARDDNNALNDPDRIVCTDLSVAGGRQFDPLTDEYRTWNPSNDEFNLENISDLINWQGLSIGIQHRDNSIFLLWSDTRDYRYENFPIENEAKLEFQSWGTTALATASDNLFIFGDGPVYVAKRNGAYLDVTEVARGYALVSKNAVATVGNMVLTVCRNGVFLWDGVSATPMRVKGLDRLLQNRWTHDTLRSTISVAYDAELDAACILCPAAAQAAILWFGDNRITMMDGMGFSHALELQVRDTATGAFRQRAVFVSFHGRVVFMSTVADSLGGGYTLHGLYDYGTGTVSGRMCAYVDSVANETKGVKAVTKLVLSTGWTATHGYHLNSLTVAILTGNRAGEIHQGWWEDNTGTLAYIRINGQFADASTTLRGQWIAVSPVPFMLVGGPLPGQDDRIFHSRKHVRDVAAVVADIVGTDRDYLDEFPLLTVGVCGISALTSGDPVPIPSEGVVVQDCLIPDSGALPRWLDLSDSSLTTAPIPASNGTPIEASAEGNYTGLGVTAGVSGQVLFPFVFSVVSGVRFDLLESEFCGTISPSDRNTGWT